MGSGLAQRALTQPHDGLNLTAFTEDERFPRHIILGGVVKEAIKQPEGRYQRLIIDSREIIRSGAGGPEELVRTAGLARIDVTDGAFVEPGDYVRLPVILRPLSGFRNPGGLSPEKFWGSQGVWVSGYVRDPALISSWPGRCPPGLMAPLRARAAEFLYERVPRPASSIMASLLLGRRSDVDAESEEIFRNLGLSHILSVSGLHLGLWYGLCLWIFLQLLRKARLFKLRAALASLLALGPALFYAALVGGASPVIRSAIMLTGAALALLARRGADSWNVMALAAWIILLAEPGRLFSASFQMSFVATLALVAVFRPRPGQETFGEKPGGTGLWTRPISWAFLKSLISRKEAAPDNWPARRGSFFRQALLASLAGTFGSAPIVLWRFGRLPLAGIAANLIFGPLLSGLVMIPGLLSLALLPLCEPLAGLLMDFAGAVLMHLTPVMEAAAQAAGPGPLLPFFGKFFLAAYFLAGAFFLRSARPFKKRLAIACAIAITGLLPYLAWGGGEKGVLRVTFLDVGQGGAIHVNFPNGRQLMIDGGGSRYFDPGERVVTPYLLRLGIGKLDYAALTHPDEDHLKGLVSLSQNFRPDEIWEKPWPPDLSPLYEDFLMKTAAIERPALQELWNGRLVGGVKVEALWPEPDGERQPRALRGDWVNDMGLALKISWGEISFLATGDIGKKTQKLLAERYGERLAATVLAAPHHGSAGAASREFLRAVRPEYVVFSAGRHNSFGHPGPLALELAAEVGASIRRTDRDGAVIFEAREKNGKMELEVKP